MASWFVIRGGDEKGPFTAAQLKEQAASGRLRPTDPVRRDDMPAARPASAIKGLFSPANTTSANVPSEVDRRAKSLLPRSVPIWQQTALIAATVVFCFPVGLVLIWLHPAWSRALKWKWTGAVAGVFICLAILSNLFPTKDKRAPGSPSTGTGKLIVKDGDEPSPEVEGTLTAKFLPSVQGNVKRYEEEVYDDKGRVLSQAEIRETYGNGVIKVEMTIASPGAPPTKSTSEFRIRVRDGFVERGTVSGNDVIWSKFIKIGAVPAANGWPDGLNTGAYHLVRFEKMTAKGAKGPYELVHALLEHRYIGRDGEGRSVQTVTEIVLEKNGGIQSEKTWITVGGKRSLCRHKRLISSVTN